MGLSPTVSHGIRLFCKDAETCMHIEWLLSMFCRSPLHSDTRRNEPVDMASARKAQTQSVSGMI